MVRPFLLILLWALAVPAAPKRVLYITTSAGFRHDNIPMSQAVKLLQGPVTSPTRFGEGSVQGLRIGAATVPALFRRVP